MNHDSYTCHGLLIIIRFMMPSRGEEHTMVCGMAYVMRCHIFVSSVFTIEIIQRNSIYTNS